jgi:hypothetical protein
MQLSTKPLGLFVSLVLLPSAAWAQAYDSGDATAEEQLNLEIINRARANPTAEGARLGIDIKEGLTAAEANNVGPRPPLAMNKKLLANARAHCRDMYNRNFFEHANPDGNDPFERMTLVGYNFINAAENIAVGSSVEVHTAAVLEDNLMIDTGISDRGHRTNLLDISGAASPPPIRREVGVGFYQNPTANGLNWRSFLTQDFGRTSSGGPFLVGVVYRDTVVANNFYDIGEGLPGVAITITAGGSGSAVTSPGGGFAIPVGTSGSVTVTASGGPLTAGTTLTQTVALTGENVRVEFKTTAVLDTDGDGIPDSWETLYSLNPNNASDAAQDPDGDGSSNLTEFRRGSNPLLAASTPTSGSGLEAPSFPYAIGPATGGPAAGGSGGGGGGGGGCGLTGLEAVLLLGLLRARRR